MQQSAANIATVSIALVALFFSAGQLYLQREQNHIAVEPRLNAYFSNEKKAGNWGIYIFNNGFGPAYVEKIDVFVDGKKIEGEKKFYQAAVLAGLDGNCLSIGEPRANDTFKLGEEIPLIIVPKEASLLECSGTRLALITLARKLNFTVGIQSIYGDRFTYSLQENRQTRL